MLTRQLWVGVTIALAVGVVTAAQGRGDDRGDRDRDSDERYAIGLWGDFPYSDVQASPGIPNLIADMNAQHLAFSIHDGDLKAGTGSPCNDALYANASLMRCADRRRPETVRR